MASTVSGKNSRSLLGKTLGYFAPGNFHAGLAAGDLKPVAFDLSCDVKVRAPRANSRQVR